MKRGRPKKQTAENIEDTKEAAETQGTLNKLRILAASIRHPVGFANYGANENRRTCHKCGSSKSKCNNTRKSGRSIIRARTCLDCGTNRVTMEIV
jgi:hypothetical protein